MCQDSAYEPADLDGGLRPVMRGAAHLFSSQILRVVANALFLVLATRGLGSENFGKVTALLALFAALIPFTSLGYSFIAVRAVSRDPARRKPIWASGASVIVLLGIPVVALIGVLVPRIMGFEFPLGFLCLFAWSELVFFSLILLFNGVLQGGERFEAMARVLAALSLVRLALLAAVYFTVGLDPASFSLAHFVATLLLLLLALAVYGKGWVWSGEPVSLQRIVSDARDGIHFALIASGRNWLIGLDKMMLPAMVGLGVAGQYATGFRVVMFTYLPVLSFMAALYPRFFRQGGKSLANGMALWRRAAPLVLAYALPAALLLYFVAPLALPVFGEDYLEVPSVIRHLAGLIVLMALYMPLGDVLVGLDRFAYRAVSVLVALACNLSLNLWLIPRLGWRGAVIAAYVSNCLLLLLYVTKIIAMHRAARKES